MKRTIIGGVLIALIGGGLLWGLKTQSQRSDASKVQSLSPAGLKPGKVAFTFSDDAQMQQFGLMWRDRQASLTRAAVMRAYWDEAKVELDQLNQQLSSTYQMRADREYTLDTDRKVLIEREARAAAPSSPPAPPATP